MDEAYEALKARARKILQRLRKAHPDAKCALAHRSAFELLIATILSAQCTDAKVNEVTPTLFRDYPTPADFATADPLELEERLRPTGFYRKKAATVREVSLGLIERYGGEVPRSMDELLRLPGVARKTANVVLGTAYGIASGIVVDTHVHRLALRMGLATSKQPEKVEQELLLLYPRSQWIAVGHTFVFHGRRVCHAKRPRCAECVILDLCPQVGLVP